MRFSSGIGLLLLAGALVGCGGGGGGGGAAPAQVSGRVLRAETNLPPNPAATATISGQSMATAGDGTFMFQSVPSNATTLQVTADPAKPRTLTIALTANQNNALGDIFVSDTGYTATATGRVVTQDTNQPVGNATVLIGGSQTQTGTDGRFTLGNLPVGLGTVPNVAIGVVKANGFTDKPIIPSFILADGVNPLGDILIASPVGSNTPSPPYTITGKVTAQGAAAPNITVTLSVGATTLGTTTTDANGAYFFWVVPAAYTVSATQQGVTKQVSVTLNRLDTPVTAPTISF